MFSSRKEKRVSEYNTMYRYWLDPAVSEKPDKRTLRQKMEDRKAEIETELAEINDALAFMSDNPKAEAFVKQMKKHG